MTAFESFIERQIREATERGAFEDLPGSGRPLPGRGRHDGPGWWTRSFIERERARSTADDRFSRLELRLGSIWHLTSEAAVRGSVTALNDQMAEINGSLPEGERRQLLDPDAIVATWKQMVRARARRSAGGEALA